MKPYFTVKDLIAHLQTVDPNLPVGKSGHFGEFHPMNKSDFHEMSASFDPAGQSSNIVGWRKLLEYPRSPVLNINTPDIGEEPD